MSSMRLNEFENDSTEFEIDSNDWMFVELKKLVVGLV
jgi:hypothetical protein